MVLWLFYVCVLKRHKTARDGDDMGHVLCRWYPFIQKAFSKVVQISLTLVSKSWWDRLVKEIRTFFSWLVFTSYNINMARFHLLVPHHHTKSLHLYVYKCLVSAHRGKCAIYLHFSITYATTVETPQCIKRKGQGRRRFADYVQYSLTNSYSPFPTLILLKRKRW